MCKLDEHREKGKAVTNPSVVFRKCNKSDVNLHRNFKRSSFFICSTSLPNFKKFSLVVFGDEQTQGTDNLQL